MARNFKGIQTFTCELCKKQWQGKYQYSICNACMQKEEDYLARHYGKNKI